MALSVVLLGLVVATSAGAQDPMPAEPAAADATPQETAGWFVPVETGCGLGMGFGCGLRIGTAYRAGWARFDLTGTFDSFWLNRGDVYQRGGPVYIQQRTFGTLTLGYEVLLPKRIYARAFGGGGLARHVWQPHAGPQVRNAAPVIVAGLEGSYRWFYLQGTYHWVLGDPLCLDDGTNCAPNPDGLTVLAGVRAEFDL